MTAASRLAIIVVNYGSSELLAANLATLSPTTPAGVFVVDNFSTSVERRVVGELAAAQGWTLVDPATNAGFGGGMNLGARAAAAAGYEAFLLLNPDATIDASAVEALAAHALDHLDEAIAPTVLRPNGAVYFAGADLRVSDGRIRSPRNRAVDDEIVGWLSGACVAISRSLWDRVGGFDDDYFLYWEDVDLSWRILRAGGILTVLNDVTAIHDEGGTHRDSGSRAEAKSPVYYYYNIRNRQLFAAKNLDAAGARRWRANDVRVAYEILLQGGRRQFLRPRTSIVPALRGLRDGRRIAVGARRCLEEVGR